MKNLSLLILILTLLIMVPLVSADYNISPQVRLQLDDIETVVQEMRDLEIQTSVATTFISRDEYADLRGIPNQNYLHEVTQFYRAFDFFEINTDLWEWSQQMGAQSEVNGVYSSAWNEITIVLLSEATLGNNLPLRERTVYAHEFAHALQNQNFDLYTLLSEYSENADQSTAFRAMVEGDAAFTTQEYVYALGETNPEILDLDLLGFGEFDSEIPTILVQEAYLPYLYGQNFVKALYREGGWDMVNDAYSNPPLSTEQILHPERYFAGDEPLEVMTYSIRNALDANEWRELKSETLGEFYLREYLSTQLDFDAVESATMGWGGDHYSLYYNDSTDERAWIFRIAWDTPFDQAEFAQTYREFAQLRMTADVQETGVVECWESATTGEALCMVANALDLQRGQESETLLAYGPSLTVAYDLVQSQRGWR